MKMTYIEDFEISEEEYEYYLKKYDFEALKKKMKGWEFYAFIRDRKLDILSDRKRKRSDAIVPFINLAEAWFQAIESGNANKRMINLDDTIPTQEASDNFVTRLEQWFKQELYIPETIEPYEYFASQGIDMPPGFDRIKGTTAAVAFFQDWLRLKRKTGYEV